MKTVVLGGGIIGVTTAYFLAKAGEEVEVVDRRPGVGLETSFANAGLISPGHSYTWASPQAPLILLKSLFDDGQSLRLKLVPDWRMYAWGLKFLRNCTSRRAYLNTARKVRLALYSQRQLQAVTETERLSYERISGGLLYLHRSQASLDRAVANMSVLTDNGLPLKVLTRADIVAREPALVASADQLAGAIFCPSDESGDAHLFTREMYQRCLRLGVIFSFDREIRGFGTNGDVIDQVETTRGPLKGDRYVLALGSYSSKIGWTLGYRLAVYPVKGYSATFPVTEASTAPDIGGVDEGHLIAWARFGGRLRFTATAEFTGYDTNHSPSDFTHMLSAAKALFPDGADYSKPSYWAGLRPMTPNGTPLLGKTRHRNLFLNTGHGHLGWTMACGTARIVADIVQGRTPEVDIDGLGFQDV